MNGIKNNWTNIDSVVCAKHDAKFFIYKNSFSREILSGNLSPMLLVPHHLSVLQLPVSASGLQPRVWQPVSAGGSDNPVSSPQQKTMAC